MKIERKTVVSHSATAALALAAALLLGGCADLNQAYVAADKQTLDGVKPLLEITKEDHPDVAQSVDDVLSTWDARVKAAEKTFEKK